MNVRNGSSVTPGFLRNDHGKHPLPERLDATDEEVYCSRHRLLISINSSCSSWRIPMVQEEETTISSQGQKQLAYQCKSNSLQTTRSSSLNEATSFCRYPNRMSDSRKQWTTTDEGARNKLMLKHTDLSTIKDAI